jgi:hypothetical protein
MDEKPALQLVISSTKIIETEDPYSVRFPRYPSPSPRGHREANG